MLDDVAWIRSYVTAEPDGTVGTICIHQATSPEAIRLHASRADLPVDEIVINSHREKGERMWRITITAGLVVVAVAVFATAAPAEGVSPAQLA